jgi:hypothetical protein
MHGSSRGTGCRRIGPSPSRKDPFDHRLRHFSERLVGLSLLAECRLKDSGAIGIAQHLCVSAGAALAGHFMVFDPLRCRNQPGIAHPLVGLSFEQFPTVGQHALHAFVTRATHRLIVTFQKFFQPISVLFSLFKVRLESGTQLRACRRLDHLGQRLEDLLLGAVERFKLVNVKGL